MEYTKVQNAQNSETMDIRLRAISLLIESSLNRIDCQPNHSRLSVWTANIKTKL